MLGPSIMTIGTPAALGYAIWASRRAPDRVPAFLALILVSLQALALALLVGVGLLA
jgi:hypothetical protein